MEYLKRAAMVCTAALLMAACQPMQEPATGGKVMSGELEGAAFMIAQGDEADKILEMVDAFNRMDLDAVWSIAADTIDFHMSGGYEGPFTKEDLAGMFAQVDSVKWMPNAVIPVKAEGSPRVSVLVDSHEMVYMKDGTVSDRKLFERFIFEDGMLTGIRQWHVEPAADEEEGEMD